MDLREEILALNDLKQETITIPEWGGKKFIVREMNGEERQEFYSACMTRGKFDSKTTPFAVTALCLRDTETGSRVFGVDDIPALKNKSGGAIERISGIGMRLSGLTESDAESAEKNSSTVIPNSSSTTRSRKNSE